jgi:hypothetical protein
VNAALKFMHADRKVWAASHWTSFCTTRWDENDPSEVKAFRRWHRIARDAIQLVYKTATKLRHLRKGVDLATTILNNCGTPHVYLHGGRLISPGVCILRLLELADEVIECRVTVPNASAIPKHGVETRWVTVIIHSDFLITLNRTGADRET